VLVHRHRPQILVIEYDPWRRSDVVAQLASAGYQVRHASNGFSGLRLARSTLPDAIVLGVDLPEVHATEIRAELGIHARTRAIPVIPLKVEPSTGRLSPDVRKLVARQVPRCL
jgi:DNA-binding response OmpR family regulator